MKKFFFESIPYEQVNPSRKQSTDFKNKHDIENKLTRFQVYRETEFACKYSNPLYKTQYSEILVKCKKGFDMTTGNKNLTLMPQVTLLTKEHHTSQLTFIKTKVNLVEN